MGFISRLTAVHDSAAAAEAQVGGGSLVGWVVRVTIRLRGTRLAVVVPRLAWRRRRRRRRSLVRPYANY